MSILGTVSKAEVVQALGILTHDLDQDGRGIQLVQVAGGYRLVTKQEYGPWLKRMDKAKAAQKLSRSALESLAIIAYKQPLVRSEIEEIRGVETSGVLRTLCERKLVRIVGRKDVPGRPIMYGTTKFFLEHFGLQDLSQLPPLREFKELGESEQALLPIEEESLVVVETSERLLLRRTSPLRVILQKVRPCGLRGRSAGLTVLIPAPRDELALHLRVQRGLSELPRIARAA